MRSTWALMCRRVMERWWEVGRLKVSGLVSAGTVAMLTRRQAARSAAATGCVPSVGRASAC